MVAQNKQSKAAQDFVPVKEVRDGILVMPDGTLRAVVMSSSINFALKSQDNQAAIIAQFQNFLNSLDFSVEIYIQSRKLDIKPYLSLLEERYRAQTSDLMKIQTREYIGFIRNFTESTNIMTKTFFVIVSFDGTAADIRKNPLGALSQLTKIKKKSDSEKEAELRNFEQNKIQLQQRVSIVEQGLIRCGLRTIKLGSEEVIELLYKLFNPGETEKPIPLEQQN